MNLDDWRPVTDVFRLPANDDSFVDWTQRYHQERASIEAEAALIAALWDRDHPMPDKAALLWHLRDESEALCAKVLQSG